MKLTYCPGFLAGALCASLLVPALASPPPQEPSSEDFAAMMEKVKQFTQPGEQHELLTRFLGEWDTETILFMGGQVGEAEKGRATFSWRMEGRWLQMESSGRFLGQELRSFWLMGYDNFKQSYVATSVSTMDTAMNHAEGDLDPGGKALLMYGTIDEYLTGEIGKMVKIVWRFVSQDELVMELHDLPIGENHTKVLEVRHTRRS